MISNAAFDQVNLIVTGGTAALNGANLLTSLTLSSGTLDGSGDATVSDAFVWTGGSMIGSGKTIIAASATGSISTSTVKYLSRTMENSGELTYDGTELAFGLNGQASGVLINQVGGSLAVVG